MQKDLVVLAADKNIEFTVKGVLSRYQALKIKRLVSDIYSHPEHDPGCLLKGKDFLRSFVSIYEHALIIFDREGCGREGATREDLEEEIEDSLSMSGWEGRASAIALDPELEVWVWSDSPHVDSVLGWEGKHPDLRTWLVQQGFLKEQQIKPERPKEAMEDALRSVRKARSSSIYFELARRVSFDRCEDPAFFKLKTTLQGWFPQDA
ncbi:MAG: hypothetical protein L0229_18115 [Blastocatellia bacterium]|nr:hypothetical protein [Blastocatellia bacterium]